MKKTISIIILLTLLVSFFSSCEFYEKPQEQAPNEIPEQNINYTNFTFGNVIQDGKQAVFLNFVSDYIVSKMEITGNLLDKSGNVIHSFDESITFGNPSYNPEMHIRIEAELVKYVADVSFTKIIAYTTQEVNTSTSEKLNHIATINSTTIDNFYTSGSTITIINEKINIQMDNNNQNGCGFRWNLSEVNLKSNTKYIVKFENISAEDIHNKSIQIETTWVDSTYTWPRYYNVKGKCFDIIASGEISSDYYQFLTSKAYDEYSIEFSFKHNVDNAKNKNLYFNIWGVKGQLSIGKISIYEVTNE